MPRGEETKLREPCDLWCAGVLVGLVRDVFVSDNTWYGKAEIALHGRSGDAEDRILGFIEFCQDWHERLERRRDDPPDPDEFERFGELIQDGSWTLRCSDGAILRIAQAPVFLKGGEISWSVVDLDV